MVQLQATCWPPAGLPAAQSVLAVKHNEIDEGNNLTDVGHSTTDVDGAKCFWDALEHIHGDAESACLALVHIHGLVDGKSHVCDVGCHHAHIHTTLHTVARLDLLRSTNVGHPGRSDHPGR